MQACEAAEAMMELIKRGYAQVVCAEHPDGERVRFKIELIDPSTDRVVA